ncbi:cystatin domain-containing protein [Vibrio fluvialis]|uniref:cystatin domain-containing protein n=1 Tax=Vibrio fluvialis TaxID=676 RepID=UPI002812D6B1|nr:cystatin domain-containing protein [Vibrio fluvialis]WPK54768.1 cystatin domain-containing protein [Vibrio fluvialis]HDV0902377.1 2-oxoglutarate dehydrogenase [Vibrio fluvialis]
MKKFVIPCLGLILLAGCDQAQQSAAEGNSTQNAVPQVTDNATSAMCSNEKLAGGWHDADVSPEAEQAVDAVLDQMGNNVRLKSILAVKTQVVNGTNYAIEFDTQDGQVWHAVVYRTLDGEFTITQGATLGDLCG